MPTFQPHQYKFSPELSFVNQVNDTGYKSEMTHVAGYNTIMLNVRVDVDFTFNVYLNNNITETNKITFFTFNGTANQPLMRKLPIFGKYLQLEIVVADTANIQSATSLTTSADSDSLTFINSNVNPYDLSVLTRQTNSYLDDVIKNQFSDVKNINIQGVTTTQIGSEHTIGMTADYKYITGGVDATLAVASANDNQPAGTGAHNVLINGILDTGAEFSSTFLVNTGSGTIGLNVVAVNRMEITSAGSNFKNDGLISLSGGATLLGNIQAGQNLSKNAYYRVPTGKQLVLRELLVKGESDGGKVILYEFNTQTQIQYPLGEFQINVGYNQINLPVHHLISSGNVIKVNYSPTLTTGDINLFVNIHALQYNNNVAI